VSTSERTARHEAERILRLTSNDLLKAVQIVQGQLHVLVLRTQVLLSLCGIVITVTGFSGRAIAATSTSARVCIACGIFVVLVAAATAIWGVLRLRWITQELRDDTLQTITAMIQIRDRKARFLGAALVLFVAGFSLYVAAIAQLLLRA
jgi:hypothetical protein